MGRYVWGVGEGEMAGKALRTTWLRIGLGLAVLAAALATAGLARGEIAQQGNVRLIFDAQFSPKSLPRDRLAPISVTVSGKISAVNGAVPPRVKRLTIGFNRGGTISSRGLPVCGAGELQSVDSDAALARCRDALVGRGYFEAFIDFPTGGFGVRGRALAFNGRRGGRPVVLLHVFVSSPIQAALVLTMNFTHPTKGQFGTVLSATVPKLAGGAGYLTGIGLTFDRHYRFHGETRSFLSASCPAPAGFTAGVFTLARGNFEFADGQHASIGLTRTCRVSGSGG